MLAKNILYQAVLNGHTARFRLASEEQHRNRTVWWGLPILPLCGWFYSGLSERHPYLDPTAENHLQQAADKVLSLAAFDIILAEHHADWIFDYAVTLARAGNLPAAIVYYQQGLKISPQAQIERDQLTALQAQSAGTSLKSSSFVLPRCMDNSSDGTSTR